MISARLWGFDGDLRGNERRLMARPPFILAAGSNRVAAARAIHWDLESGKGLHWFSSPEEAREYGTDLQLLTEVVPVAPGQFVVLAGPDFLADLDEAGLHLPEGWTVAAAGFRIRCMQPSEYEQFTRNMAKRATDVFDEGVRRNAQKPPDGRMRAALRILQRNSGTPLEDRQVRAIHTAELDRDADLYARLVQMTAIRLNETEEAVRQRVQRYRRDALESAWPLDSNLLAELGMDPRAMGNRDLPEELRFAIASLAQLPFWFDRKPLIDIARSDECLVCLSAFARGGPPDRTLLSQQEELRDFLENAGIGVVHSRTGDLGEITDSTFARSQRTFYAFPFVLTPERRDRWSVIPYASHRSIGMLIHVDNPFYNVWKRGAAERVGRQDRIGAAAIPFADIRTHLPEFFRRMLVKQGHVFYRRDQLAGELFRQMIGVPPLGILQPLITKEMVEQLFFGPSYANQDNVGDKRAAQEWDVFLFDMTDRAFAALPRNGFSPVEIEHGLAIPVGVGFSLSALPAFVGDAGLKRWKTIQHKAKEIFHGAEFLDEFGIEFGAPVQDDLPLTELA